MKTKEKVKELWKLCFDDSDEFVEMYFRLRYTNETTMYLQSGNMIVSSLQMPCYPLTFEGNEIQAAYISGACTHPDFRGKGVMAQLLAESFSRMVQKNIPVSFLIPANPGLYDYYAKTGYAKAFFRSQKKQQVSDITVAKGNLHFEHTTTSDQRIFDYFIKKALQRPNYIQHTSADLEAVMEDLRMSGGSITIARHGSQTSSQQASHGRIAGILFAYPEDDYLKVTEWFADNDGIRDNLFREAAHYHNQSDILWFERPTHSAEEQAFGMARIINAQKMLELYAAAHPEKKINIHLTDEQLTFNNGYYSINRGSCSFSQKPHQNGHIEMTIQQLSTLVFDEARLYMSLMLE